MRNEKNQIEIRLINVKLLAKYISSPIASVYKMVRNNEIPYKRIGEASIRFDLREIDNWIDNLNSGKR